MDQQQPAVLRVVVVVEDLGGPSSVRLGDVLVVVRSVGVVSKIAPADLD